MPKRTRELSALEVSRLNTDGLHAVGGVVGLYLQIKRPSKAWILRAVIGAQRRDMGLGSFPTVTLASARERAREARLAISQGADPILDRQRAQSALKAEQASALSFADATRQFLDAKAPEWRNEKHRQQWTNTLDTYAMPVIGKVHVAEVGKEHVLTILTPIWHSKTETARRLRGRIEQVLDWATARGYRDGLNPARWRGHLDKLLAAPTRIMKVEHHAAIPIDEVPAFMAALRTREGSGARALELAALTAARSGEVRGATWSEFDLTKRLWVIPAARMKANREHRVPLSESSIRLLEAQPHQAGTDLVFPGTKGQPLSDGTLNAVMRRIGVDAVAHGLRSTFRDWVSERTAYSSDIAEMALAHTIKNKVEAAYRRGDVLEKRRQMMEAWDAFCTAPSADGPNVFALRAAA